MDSTSELCSPIEGAPRRYSIGVALSFAKAPGCRTVRPRRASSLSRQ